MFLQIECKDYKFSVEYFIIACILTCRLNKTFGVMELQRIRGVPALLTKEYGLTILFGAGENIKTLEVPAVAQMSCWL
jgi:hypothetical protein